MRYTVARTIIAGSRRVVSWLVIIILCISRFDSILTQRSPSATRYTNYDTLHTTNMMMRYTNAILYRYPV